jgi:hypothetical protein
LLGFGSMPAAFWIALCVLVLNDHLLKGSGLLPSQVTGKLSDFAGLIVAPVLLCVVLSVRTDRGRGLAIGLIALAFAAIKLSPTCAHGAAALLTMLGVPSRIWCDPTDLIAFAVLPWAALLARHVQPAPARLSRRITVAVASLACVATSSDRPNPMVVHGPFLINWTRSPIVANVTRSWASCDQPLAGGETFAPQGMPMMLEPAQISAIGWDLSAFDAGLGSDCGLADIQIADKRIRVAWGPLVGQGVGGLDSDQAYDDNFAFDRGIIVYGSAESPSFELGTVLQQDGIEP